tara:strand:- start:6490 stop:7785 length:1296 start_codon:yes stop_codon:yes gene_type:complete
MGNSDALQALAILTGAVSKAHSANLAAEQKRLDRDLIRESEDKKNQIAILNHMITLNEKKSDRLEKEIVLYENKFLETTGQLYKLSDEQKTSGSNNVLKLTGHTMNDLNSLLDSVKDEKSYNIGKLNSLKQDLAKVSLIQDFYKGVGHDYKTGSDIESWDIGDFSDKELSSYMNKFPELEGVEGKPFFAGVKARQISGLDAQMQALNKLLSDERLRAKKEERYDQILDKSGDADKVTTKNQKVANDWYDQRLSNTSINSGVAGATALRLKAMDFADKQGIDPTDVSQNPDLKRALDMESNIAKDLAKLYGVQGSMDLYYDYKDMISAAEGTVVGGRYSKGDPTVYHRSVEKAYENYKNAPEHKQFELEKLAQRYFGFNGSFKAFYDNEKTQYINQLLVPMEESGQVDSSSVEELTNEVEWDNLLEEDLYNE